MTISVTTPDPLLSVQIARTLVINLTVRVRAIYTQRTRENLNFIRERFAEVDSELVVAEDKLASFLDRNRNPQSAVLRTQSERFQRQVTFKSELFREMFVVYQSVREEQELYRLQRRMTRQAGRRFTEKEIEKIVFEDR